MKQRKEVITEDKYTLTMTSEVEQGKPFDTAIKLELHGLVISGDDIEAFKAEISCLIGNYKI